MHVFITGITWKVIKGPMFHEDVSRMLTYSNKIQKMEIHRPFPQKRPQQRLHHSPFLDT